MGMFEPTSSTTVRSSSEREQPFFAPARYARQNAADQTVSGQGSIANPSFFFSSAKSAGNQPGLKYEQGMDRTNHQAMRMPAPQLLGTCSCGKPILAGGECKECQKKREDQNQRSKPNLISASKIPKAGFIGEVEGIPALTGQVDSGIPAIVPPPSGGNCTDICNRAYANSSLNGGGGGVICDGATKCACVFDVPPLTRGQCPDLDTVVANHERQHLTDVDCDSTQGLHRPPFRNQGDATTSECTHRRASIAELDVVIPSQSATCKTGMTTIRNGLRSWVTANCGA